MDPITIGIAVVAALIFLPKLFGASAPKEPGTPSALDSLKASIASQLREHETSQPSNSVTPVRKRKVGGLDALANFLANVPEEHRQQVIDQYAAGFFRKDYGLEERDAE